MAQRGTTLVVGAFALIASTAYSAAAYIPNNDGKIIWGAEQETPRYARKHIAKRHHNRKVAKKRLRIDDSGSKGVPWNMVKVKTVQGFYLTVHPAYAHKFLRFFEILAQNNVKVPKDLVGCYSRGGHVSGSNHYIGAACDIQTGWNRTIPALQYGHAGKWIRQAGLYDGCSFGDCGHIEAVRGTHNAKRVPNLYAAMAKFKADEATANFQP
jgi:hypothetical protein